jgi:hypothetical protein
MDGAEWERGENNLLVWQKTITLTIRNNEAITDYRSRFGSGQKLFKALFGFR